MADEEFEVLKDAPVSSLSTEFRSRLWDEIDGELRGSPGTAVVAVSRGESRRGSRRWIGVAVVVALCVGTAALFVRSDGHRRVASTPESVPTSEVSASSTISVLPPTTLETAPTPTPLPIATSATSDGPIPAIAGSWIENYAITSDTSGWVVTDLVVAHTNDAGNHWVQQQLTPLAPFSNGPPLRSFILDDERAWIAKSDGGEVAVSRTENGAGSIETTRITTDFGQAWPLALVFLDALNGVLSVGENAPWSDSTDRVLLYRTSDGGKSFVLADPQSRVPAVFADQSLGWSVSDGLFVTKDGGATWTRVTPPGWDIDTVDGGGPDYDVLFASAELTVIKLYAATGLQAQVRYLATRDQGVTWDDVAPPGTSEVSGTGPQSMLTVTSPSLWFAIQQSMTDDAILWATTNAGRTYFATQLPFAARGLTMATPTTGWAATAEDLRLTQDGGMTWRKIADIIAPAVLPDGCIWQPNFDGHDGAAQRTEIVIRLTNFGEASCKTSTVAGLSAVSGEVEVTGSAGGFFQVSPAQAVVDPGRSIVVIITVVNALEACGNPASQPIADVIIRFSNGDQSIVPLEFPLETACEFSFVVGSEQ